MDSQGLQPQDPPTPAKTFWRRLSVFTRELWNDHDFWVRALAIKGGASAIVAAGVVAVSHVVALPLFLAIGGIVACTGLVGLGLYGTVVGAMSAWEQLRHIYYRTFFDTEPPQKPADVQPFHLRVASHARMRRVIEAPLTQKIISSRAWKMTAALSQKQRDLFLTGLAGGGSIFWVVLSAVTLVTQIVLLPVVTIGSVLTFGTVLVVGGFLSAVYGIYLSIQSLLKWLRSKKKT